MSAGLFHLRFSILLQNPDIAALRKESIRARRILTRHRTISRGPLNDQVDRALNEAFLLKRKHYTNAILKAKRECCKELIGQLKNDIWGLPYKIVRNKLGGRRIKLAPDAIADAVRELFPKRTPYRREHQHVVVEEIPEVTNLEVIAAADRLASKKAPGPAGIPAEVTKKLMKRWPSIFASMATGIPRSGVFPARWKTAKLVLIPKAKKNIFRPICLLDTAAKAVETIILRKLQDELEEKEGLAENQYGFRPGRSTLSALKELYEEVLKEKAKTWRRRKRCAIILLDIRNAFNSLEWGVIAGSLQKRGISAYIRRIIGSYLQDRYIVDEDGTRHEVTAGVP